MENYSEPALTEDFIDQPDDKWFKYCQVHQHNRSEAFEDYEIIVEKLRNTDNESLKLEILSVLCNIVSMLDTVPEPIARAFLLELDDAVRSCEKRENTVFSDYIEFMDETNSSLVKSKVRDRYDTRVGFEEISPSKHYLVITESGEILSEIFITDQKSYLSEYLHFSEYFMSDPNISKAQLSVKGLIYCCDRDSQPSARILDRVLFLIKEIPNEQIVTNSCILLEKYSQSSRESVVESQDEIFKTLMEANNRGYERAFKSIYKIADELHPDIDDNDVIAKYLKNRIHNIHGGDKKMCRRSIAKITGEHRLSLYYKELKGEL